jgi:CBS domain-containing protein
VKARDVMSRPVVSVQPETTVADAITILTQKGFGAVPVVDDLGRVVGIFSESDALRATAGSLADRASYRAQPVSVAMTTPVEVISPHADVVAVAEHMLDGRLRCVPVVESGLLIGVVARRDLLRTMVRDDDVIAANVRALLDDYAGSRRRWTVEVTAGAVVISGEFADQAERSVIAALARTTAGVVTVEVRPTTGVSLGWDD